MSDFHLILSSPDGSVFDGRSEGVILRGALGDLAVLAGHMPMITTVKPGICRILLEGGREKRVKIGGGLLSVGRDAVTLLCATFSEEGEDGQ